MYDDTNGAESFRSMPRRGHKGIHYKMSPKHLDRYVQEFAGCHNLCHADTLRQMGTVVRALEGRHTTYHRPYRTERSSIGSPVMKKADRMERLAAPADPYPRPHGGYPRRAAGGQ